MIDQIACPAYCCTLAGAVLYCNRSARRLWGNRPSRDQDGCWDGFTALCHADGRPMAKSASPAAQAARTGIAPAATELIAQSADGQKRCLIVHAVPLGGTDGAISGVLCSLTDISERSRLACEVEFARASREGFLRVLAHELRNPLASVMTVAAILRRQPGELGMAWMAHVIERQTRQLARFIDDLLDTSRIEQACEIPISMHDSGVDAILALARDVVDGVLRSRGQHLHLEVDAATSLNALIWCDPERLAQALGNVMLNASQYSEDGAEISLAIMIDGVFLRMRVSDQGIGVEPSELPLLFEPFRQFARHPRRAPAGAGLGLAIARTVCLAHGGTLSAHSPGRGQGTCLEFMLPIVRDAVPA